MRFFGRNLILILALTIVWQSSVEGQSGSGAGVGQGAQGQGISSGTQSGNSQQGTTQSPSQTNSPNQSTTAQPATQGIGGPPSSRGAGVITDAQAIPGAATITTQAPSTLSLEQAIQIAINNNLATLLANERRREAEGRQQQSLSGLLPDIEGTTYQANVTSNLAALGFQPGTFPGISNTFIGPFNNFDARVRLVQNIFSLSAIRNYQAGRAGVRLADYQRQSAREQVASGTALTYLETLRAGRAVAAAQANVDLANTLLTLARDQRNAGVATGVDVTRAQTRLAAEQVRLAQAQTASEQATLNLQRVVGLPLGAALTLSDTLRFKDETLPSAENLITQAAQNRPEIRIAEEQIKVSQLESASVRAENLPSLAFIGDYGVSGITPTNTDLPTRRAAIQLNVPIFNGGLTRGRQIVAESRARQAELEFGNVRGQVEQDVRLALATLRTTVQQVSAANDSVTLAERELQMSRDRFRAGVANNLEVVNAQTSLAAARDAQVAALAQYNAARVNLAAAIGRAEEFRW